ncbi:hypothetical protein [Sporisorium scitamineum]|uniref:Uncharacterized protein n=1 Tax=Sporisorium scitamineum TaxID=49012 RepID=A0A0F7RTM1_9BASI|nr:hypothetical protein [Sporisorium scitamineum]
MNVFPCIIPFSALWLLAAVHRIVASRPLAAFPVPYIPNVNFKARARARARAKRGP